MLDICASRGNACICIYMPLQAFIHETDANLELQHYMVDLHDRGPLQAQSAVSVRIATRDCLSWHWILWRLLPLKPMLNDYSRCVVI